MGNVQFVKGVYEAFGRGDIATVLGAMDPAIEWRRPKATRTCRAGSRGSGPTRPHQLFMRIGTDWDGFKVHPKPFTTRANGRRGGPLHGAGKATGKDAGTGSRPATSGACAMVASSVSSSMSTPRDCRT